MKTFATFKVKNSKLVTVDEVPIIYFDGMVNSMAITEHFDIIIGSDEGQESSCLCCIMQFA